MSGILESICAVIGAHGAHAPAHDAHVEGHAPEVAHVAEHSAEPPAVPGMESIEELERRRPGVRAELPEATDQTNEGAVRPPPPEAFPTDHLPVPDRWRIVENIGVKERWWDPYNQNTLKGDRPIAGTSDCFLVVSAISDTIVEPRSFPIPVGVQTTDRPGRLDVFGRTNSEVFAQTLIGSVSFIKGSTAYMPPSVELRLTLAANYNYVNVPEKRVLFVEPSKGTDRSDAFLGVQELFLDYHFRDVSARYDFDSVRIGIQPFSTDFRGFLFQDSQPGIRFFGNRDNNRFQYNLAVFGRLEKDTNSGLNAVTRTPRDDLIFLASLYRQDLPVVGLTSQATIVYNRNREANSIEVDTNGFPVRPGLIGNLRARDYDVVYLGYNADGRLGRINVTASAYAAFGEDRDNIFTGRPADIRAYFAAVEPSYDFNWIRVRLSGLYASGDSDPYDNRQGGFDAIFENPQFAGADTSYWIRQTIPFAGGGRVIGIQGRNGILNSLRSSKEQGQSNFANPGTLLAGVGADLDVTPEWRLSGSLNHLWFENTAVLKALRQEGSIPKEIGWDASVAATWRPFFTQNIVVRASAAVFDPGDGFSDLFSNATGDDRYYSVLLNATLTF
jgi:hypothetical protein